MGAAAVLRHGVEWFGNAASNGGGKLKARPYAMPLVSVFRVISSTVIVTRRVFPET